METGFPRRRERELVTPNATRHRTRICRAKLALTAAPYVSLTSGRPCFATGLSACPGHPQATARRFTLPARSQNSAQTRPPRLLAPSTPQGAALKWFSGLFSLLFIFSLSPSPARSNRGPGPWCPLKTTPTGRPVCAGFFGEGRETEDEQQSTQKKDHENEKTKYEGTQEPIRTVEH